MTTPASSRHARQRGTNGGSTKSAEPSWNAEPEETVEIAFRAPQAAADAITTMAQYFEVSSEALIRRYVATGLLQDEARYFREQALATVEDALRGRLADPELVEAVIDDARAALARRANPRGRSPEKVAEIHSKAGRRVEGVELPFSSD